MKKIIVTALFIMSLVFATVSLMAQGAPPPPPDGHGSSINQPAEGGGAPIGGGLGILLALGAAYGGRKVYQAWKDQQEK